MLLSSSTSSIFSKTIVKYFTISSLSSFSESISLRDSGSVDMDINASIYDSIKAASSTPISLYISSITVSRSMDM